jgi:hypothetical protein
VKKTPLFITLGLFVLLAGGFLAYQYFFKKDTTTIWDMVPEQTVLLYEANDCPTCDTKPSVISKLLEKLVLDFEGNDSIAKSMNFLSVPAKGNALSVHVTSKDNFDVVYYFSARQASNFKSVTDGWKKAKGVRFSERKLNGMKILEFSFPNKRLFSCVQLGDAWAGSFTSFLIEDVVRTYERKDEQFFKKEMAGVYALPRIKDDAGDVYIHLQNLTSWLAIFPEVTGDLKRLGNTGLLDIKKTDQSITLNGFSLAQPETANGLLSYFLNQTPVQFSVKQYISNQTVFALNYGISDGAALYQNLDLYKDITTLDSLAAFADIDFEKLFASFGKEMAVCYQESKSNSLSKVIVFETQKPGDWLVAFKKLAESSAKEDTVFYEQYSTYEIREIEISNLCGKLFSPLTSGFAQTYYTSIGNFIILSERLEDMKRFLEDIDQENVWGKSVAINKFLESTLLESNLSIYVNTPLVWNSVAEKLNPRWQTFIQNNRSLLQAVDLGAIQFSHLNESFYTNITWTYSEYAETNTKQDNVRPSGKLVASLNAAVITEPIVVKSHVNREDEVLVQDSAFVVYHLSDDGKVLWQKSLNERIVGDIHQVDFFNNGKLQFFFATTNSLHVIDRLGNYVTPFPQPIEIKDLAHVTVVDYDKSKKYRFLLSDRSGKVWMFDKDAKLLEGWLPKNIGGDLFAASQHYRIRGKDYIIAIRKDGQAYVMNRRGETLKGFPLDLEARPNGAYYLETGNSLETTNFVCVSRDGFKIKFNLKGKIVSRETLIKPSFDAQFGLVREQNEKSYLVKQQDAKRLTLLNEDNKEILSNDFIGTSPVTIKYYDFGAGKIYISITDLSQDLSFVYNGDGKLLNATPLLGNALELRPSKGDMPKTFLVDQNTLIIE